MRRQRTEDEIEKSQYISLAEIMRLYGYGRQTAKAIYTSAERIDLQELGEFRPITTRVRTKSVNRVLGIKNGGHSLRKTNRLDDLEKSS